ncbi:hypothetical protein [Halorussus sp. AFM4]|uniref:hypothetical protein n=1 Tax=Halorussus sp. AFM4 TaxID=3421651 RepID=UPI003EB697BE
MTDDEIDHYRCPYCPAEPYTSAKEREVRVHIELASDSGHKGREGFSPVTTVEAVDDEGNLVENTDSEAVKRNPDEFDETCDPDDDLSDTERRIIATKMMNLDYTAQEITEFLDEKGDAPHVEKVRTTLRDYFGTTAIARGHRSYDEFDDRQQAAIDAAARYELGEYDTQAEAAEAIGERAAYVSRYYNNHEEIVQQRAREIENEQTSAGGESTTIRRENGTGTYIGSEEGIDATMQHISERPTTGNSRDDLEMGEDTPSEESVAPDGGLEMDSIRAQVKLLRRLVSSGELDATTALDEVERILSALDAS